MTVARRQQFEREIAEEDPEAIKKRRHLTEALASLQAQKTAGQSEASAVCVHGRWLTSYTHSSLDRLQLDSLRSRRYRPQKAARPLLRAPRRDRRGFCRPRPR